MPVTASHTAPIGDQPCVIAPSSGGFTPRAPKVVEGARDAWGSFARTPTRGKFGRGGAFTRRYELKRLFWQEHRDDIRAAIQRERSMKHCSRVLKVRLILQMNPEREDLHTRLNW